MKSFLFIPQGIDSTASASSILSTVIKIVYVKGR